ncbi:hypothetical protein OG978_10255 [Streptomyces sp. NBC_01591]|uniref:hypothetical protein n=1 Tax=Streptomyces sp. NBC_01591 TaxID=2975888 RepID=UPI002DDC3C5A|nr:hypothetical protein [Streptomyces sp. NBC_01591]WSD67733.1 hypothetical protein OG978_10255 [Streptomyces sp. NBC_01591]
MSRMDITSTPAEHTDRGVRRASWFALGMLVPVSVGSGLLTLSSTRASGCVTYGVQCADVPDGSIPGAPAGAVAL